MPWPFLIEALLITFAAWLAGLGLLPVLFGPATVGQWACAAAAVAILAALAYRGLRGAKEDVDLAEPGSSRTMAYVEVFASRAVVAAAVVAYRVYVTGRWL